MARTTDQVLAEISTKMPSGWAWPLMRQPGSNAGKLARAFAAGIANAEVAAGSILDQIDPGQATSLLDDYERLLGPDPCLGDVRDFDLATRQQIAHARWVGHGVASAAEMEALAASLGYLITVTEFAPARCDVTTTDQPAFGDDWAFVWSVRVLSGPSIPLIECELRRRAPAHTVVLFAKGVPGKFDQTGFDSSTFYEEW